MIALFDALAIAANLLIGYLLEAPWVGVPGALLIAFFAGIRVGGKSKES